MMRGALLACLCACSAPPSDTPRPEPPPRASACPTCPAPTEKFLPLPADREIESMVESIDKKRIEADVKALAAFGTRHSLSDTESATRGIGAARRWLKTRFDEIATSADGRLTVRSDAYTAPKGPRIPKASPMENVVAVLAGSEPARTVVVTGHYDSRATDIMDAKSDAPGANDDASGVAVVLEACRALAPHRFSATIVFAAVSGEEQGLFGSAALLARLKADGARVEAMFTNDIVGMSESLGGKKDKAHVRVFSDGLPPPGALRDTLLKVGGEADGPSRQLARAVVETTARYVGGFEAMLVARLDRYLRGGDHRPFHEAGIPAARFTEVHENFNRQHQDVREGYGDLFVDPAYIAQVTRVNVAALASLARAPSPPETVRLDVRDLAEDSTIVWLPAQGVSYELLARPTDQAHWTRAFDAGSSGSFTVPLSKDHWHFALRAVGPAGHRSLAVFPLPLEKGAPWPP